MKKSTSFYGSCLTLSQQHAFFRKCRGFFVKIKSIIDLLFFIKQVFEWTRFAKLKRSQKFSSLSLSELELLTSMLKLPIVIRFPYLHKPLLITSFFSSMNVLIFTVDGGLYTLKQIHFFFEIVNSEQIHSLQLGSYCFNLLQIKPCLTKSLSPPPYLCLSLFTLICIH